ncbi:glycosyltransferase family 2 protein [Vibrio hyugaensis]|uniref:glycosyltransferase family 2 protein n=1 Tax=Vibrio hyugaensis TaxID=1534743 RepID=UPI003DA16185
MSIVIPTHNRDETTLLRAINSCIKQTLKPFEIVVVDDVCNKRVKEFVESIEFDNIKYLENKEQGASASRNLGAKNAKGNYIAFLDDDDIWLPEKLELQVNQVVSEQAKAVFAQMFVEYEDLGIKYITKSKNVPDPLKQICTENYIGGTISSLIEKQLFLELGGFDRAFSAREEYDLWIRIIASGSKISVVERPLTVAYRSFIRDRVSSNISSYENAIDLLNKKHKQLALDVLDESERKRRESKQYSFLAAQAISINKGCVASKYYFKSFLKSFSPKFMILSILSLFSPKFLIMLRSKM